MLAIWAGKADEGFIRISNLCSAVSHPSESLAAACCLFHSQWADLTCFSI
jgi:hypothetical protein